MNPIRIVFPSFLLAALLPAQQTIELETGEVVIGKVVEHEGDTIRVEVGFPETEVRSIARDAIAPRAMFDILAAEADTDSPDDLRHLAREAVDLGLPAHAISALRRASKLDPQGSTKDIGEVRRIREDIAEQLMEQARAWFLAGRLEAARLDASVIVDSFRDTGVHDDAEDLIEEIEQRRSAARPDLEPIDTEQIEEALEAARERIDRIGELDFAKGAGLEGEDRDNHQRAIEILENTWESFAGFRPGDEVIAQVGDAFEAMREKIRTELVSHYEQLGTIYVQRRALPEAAELNRKACRLAPDSPACERLRDLIVQARIVDGWR